MKKFNKAVKNFKRELSYFKKSLILAFATCPVCHSSNVRSSNYELDSMIIGDTIFKTETYITVCRNCNRQVSHEATWVTTLNEEHNN